MATNQEIIQQRRRAIEQAQKQIQESARKEKVSKAQLLQKQSGLAARAQRKSRAQIKQRASQQVQAQIRAQEKAFETQVAQLAPQYAKPQYLEAVYQTAKKDISGKLASIQTRIVNVQKELEQASRKGRETERFERNLETLKSEAGTYRGVLAGSKESLVKGYYTGATIQQVGFEAQRIESGYERARAKESFAQAQGFKTFTEYQRALGAQVQLGVVSQVKISQPGVATYDPSTAIYTSPEGFQSSIPLTHIPKGTQIVGPTFIQHPI